MKRIFLIVLLGIVCQMVNAQKENNNYRPLAIGELMPDIIFSNIDNYPNKELKFSELRGKIIIIDFWSTRCPGCLAQFPKLEALQRKFGDELQVILVTYESREEVRNRFLTMSSLFQEYKTTVIRLPSITKDTLLRKFFPHIFIPHEVWIDKNGRVMAFTDERSLTEKTVQRILDGYFDLPIKKDILTYRNNEPMLPQIIDSAKNKEHFYSFLIRGISGFRSPSYNTEDPVKRSFTMTRMTIPILKLYGEALSKGAPGEDPFKDAYFDYGKRVILEVKDSSRYFYDSSMRYDKWFEKNCYAFEQVIPIEQKENRYELMRNELNRYLFINGRVEKRKMKCLSIIRLSNHQKFKFEVVANYAGPRHWLDSNNVFHFRSTSFKVFRMKLSEFNQSHPLPFVDDTGYTGLIQMDLESPLDDIAMLRKELRRKYDLDIVEKIQPVEVMILTEREYKK